MDKVLVLKAILTLGSLGFALGLALALAYLKLAVKVNPQLKKILEILPGTNCGACGYAGCEGYAQGMANSEAPVNLCAPGGGEVAQRLAEALGVELKDIEQKVAILKCQGGKAEVGNSFLYYGVENCRAAYLVHGGPKSCVYGCLGLGTCVEVCPFDAIKLGDNCLPIIDENLCTGCGLCVDACPVNIIALIPFPQKIYVGCSSYDKGKETRTICSVGCIACKICEKSCPYDAIHVIDNVAEIDYSKCTSCGICVHKCPTKSIVDKVKVRPYAIIGINCNGCGECLKVCQFKAIEGQPQKRHKIIRERCIGCGSCFQVCQPKAITMAGALGHTERAA